MPSTDQPRVAYVARRFPLLTETFVVREVAALTRVRQGGVSVFPLFDSRRSIDEEAYAGGVGAIDRRATPNPRHQIAGLAYWLRRRPLTFARVAARMVWDSRSSLRDVGIALVCLPRVAAVARGVRAGGFSHIHAHFATHAAGAALAAATLADVTWSFTPHAYDLFGTNPGLAHRVSRAGFVVAITNFHRGFLRSFSSDETRHPVIHCGLDLSRHSGQRSQPGQGPRAQSWAVLCNATFTEKKGHSVLLRAFKQVLDIHPAAELRLIGLGERKATTEKLASELGIASSVRFLGGMPQDEVTAHLLESDLLVQSSLVAADGDTEGLPIAILEAMSLGVPVVATAVAGVPEVVRSGDTGTLVTPDDERALSAAILQVLAEYDKTAATTRRARRLIESEFDVLDSARQLSARIDATVYAQ